MTDVTIHDETSCQLGEGPLWHPERQQLFWFDILNRRLHTKGRHWEFPDYVSAAGWVDRSTLLVASARSLFRFDIDHGTETKIADLEHDDDVTRSNDGRADPQGGFWIGTMGIEAEDGKGSIWRYWKGELRRLHSGITISNGICFAPDGRTAYFCDTALSEIMAQSLDPETGWPMGEPRVHIDLREGNYHPDGAVCDAAGNYVSAQWGDHRIAIFDPEGRHIEDITLPARQITCPAFGGEDLSTLYATSAAVGLEGDEAGAHEGQTFAIATGYKGQREHRVLL